MYASKRLLLVAVAAVAAVAVLAPACGDDAPIAVDGGAAPTAAPTTTAAPEPEPLTAVSVYLTAGEGLQPVERLVPEDEDLPAQAVRQLLEGPSDRDANVGFGSEVPAGTQFLGLVTDDGIATVNLSRQFEAGGGTLSFTMRLAQVACTLDAFEGVEGVRFALDGEVVTVFGGDGLLLDGPVTCADYAELGGARPQPQGET